MHVSVYRPLGYMDVVHEVAEASMNLAVQKIKEHPDYAQSGEVWYIVHLHTCTCIYMPIVVYVCLWAVGHH